MVGDNDIGAGRDAPRPVQEAASREEGAALLEAVVGVCLDVGSWQACPADVERVEVAIARLCREAQKRGEHIDDVAVVFLVGACHLLELAQTQVMVVALEGHVR